MLHKFNPNLHHRRSVRLAGYDYSQDGWYFLTICTHKHKCIFGSLVHDEMQLSNYGRIVQRCWNWLTSQYDYVELDEYVVMPNHLHAILVIRRGGSRTAPHRNTRTGGRGEARLAPIGTPVVTEQGGSSPAPTKKIYTLGRLVGTFKTVSTKQINISRKTPGRMIWQRNYYEHIIRNEDGLNRIRQYIAENPARWLYDLENPDHIGSVLP